VVLASADHAFTGCFTDDQLEFSIGLYPSFDNLTKPFKLTVLIWNLVMVLILFGEHYLTIAKVQESY
jgi:hypothetical protein